MTTKTPPEILLIDFKSIILHEDTDREIVLISDDDSFFINRAFCDDFRIRKTIYGMMKKAQKSLPGNYNFMVYEAYRPLARQVYLWGKAEKKFRQEYPHLDEKKLRDLTETFVADPFNGIGSGHQAACAIDISLCDDSGKEYDMGCGCQELCPLAPTFIDGISAEAKKNRKILFDALEGAGLVNYPPEWWHFSYGDHQWAHLKGLKEAVYGPLDLPAMAADPARARAAARG